MAAQFSQASSHQDPVHQARVLTKALLRMADYLQLSRAELSSIIGKSEATFSRLYTNKNILLSPESKEGQLTLLLLRLYRSLDTLFGGNTNHCQQWLRHYNHHLQSIPIERIQSIEGLVITVQYLDAMRGKI